MPNWPTYAPSRPSASRPAEESAMATCPKGHTSVATDYCDECGAPIAPPAAVAAPAPAAPSTVEPDPAVASEPCPECQTPRDGRFCEVCGHDFLAPSSGSPAPAASAPPALPEQSTV